MTKGKEELRDFIKVSVLEAFRDHEEKLEEICRKNATIAIQEHELCCPSRDSKVKSVINWTSFAGMVSLVIEKIFNNPHK